MQGYECPYEDIWSSMKAIAAEDSPESLYDTSSGFSINDCGSFEDSRILNSEPDEQPPETAIRYCSSIDVIDEVFKNECNLVPEGGYDCVYFIILILFFPAAYLLL